MEGQFRSVLREKIADALASPLPALTRREALLPRIPRKARAVTGMRRSGKTCFLHQCLRDRLEAGVPREALLYLSFEDERLAGMTAADLGGIVEEYYVRCPQFRDRREVTFFFDEIQVVPGWETFIRRLLDSEKAEIFVSGSSAKMLGREVASSLRGRSTETVIFPFSFREYLTHRGLELPADPRFVPKAARSRLERAFRDYLEAGGFPEAQGLGPEDRLPLLQGYVDTCLFRDVVERHELPNVVALRQLVRRLLGAPAGRFSVHKFHADLRSQGVAVSKDLLYAMLAHLEDAFLIRISSLAEASERRRQVNPRKIYPVDPGLIAAFDRTGSRNLGQALETAVRIELERRRCETGYVTTPAGYEVDFLATPLQGPSQLIQVAAEVGDPETLDRELRALADARPAQRGPRGLLLTISGRETAELPKGVELRPAWEWMLEFGKRA